MLTTWAGVVSEVLPTKQHITRRKLFSVVIQALPDGDTNLFWESILLHPKP